MSFQDRFEALGEAQDLEDSTAAFMAAVSCSNSLPATRLIGARSAARNMLREDQWDSSAKALDKALEVLPDLTPRTNSREDMQNALRTVSGLAPLAASVFLKAKREPAEALQALEKGRGIIASFMIDARSDLSALKEAHPDLWSQYISLRKQINSINTMVDSGFQMNGEETYAATIERLRQLYDGLDATRTKIRACLGFERFLLSPTEQELRELAQEGPLVSFNVSTASSDAFIVSLGRIEAIPLPDLKLEAIRSCVRLLASRSHSARRDASIVEDEEDDQGESPSISNVLSGLEYLWTAAVEPVLRHLGLLRQENSPPHLPRIWWIGGGIMALAPLHAAGFHESGSIENTLSHVISSYSPTFKALQFIRSKFVVSKKQTENGVAVVSMPTTPGGYEPLNVEKETAAIANQSGSWASVEVLNQPTKADVLSALESYTVVHFACHGTADPVEPAKGALLLGKDVEERLAIADLDAVAYQHAQMIFLSACSTAETKVQNLVDESIHIASAFLLVGFQNVVGTLWGVDDAAAAKVAKKFYERASLYTKNGSILVAQALHDAVVCLRDEDSLAISKWAPFIHLGS